MLNCWGDEHCIKVLKNCYKAVLNNGKVIVINSVLSMVPETSKAARDVENMQVHLLMRADGGQERNKQEWIKLAHDSGFKGINFVCCVCNFHIMEFYK